MSPRDALVTASRAALAVAVAVALIGACGGTPLPEPIRAPPCIAAPCRSAHEGEDPVLVPFPPPPAKVDVIGAPPPELTDPVWVDGQWEWRGRAWIWEPGKWWQRPTSQYWAAPAIVRRADGQLVWFAGTFRPFGSPLPGAPPPPSSAPSSATSSGTLSSPDAPGDKAGQAP